VFTIPHTVIMLHCSHYHISNSGYIKSHTAKKIRETSVTWPDTFSMWHRPTHSHSYC